MRNGSAVSPPSESSCLLQPSKDERYEWQFNQSSEDSDRWKAILGLLFLAGTNRRSQD